MAEIVRTRVFHPHDVQTPTEDEIRARIEELKAKRNSFDPKTQFTGLRRLGPTYTVAEPFAYFDGASADQNRISYALVYGGFGMITYLGIIWGHKIMNSPFLTGMVRGLISAPIGAYFGGKMYDWNTKRLQRKNNILFHYALLHEKDFPVIGIIISFIFRLILNYSFIFVERKKYGDIIQDWTAHRSLNILGKGNMEYF